MLNQAGRWLALLAAAAVIGPNHYFHGANRLEEGHAPSHSPAKAGHYVQNGQQDAGPVTVQLIAFNDFHGHLEPPPGATGRVNDTEAGGAEYLATHIKKAAAENPNTLIVAAGDLIGASPLIAGLFHDEPTIEAMNAMGLAISAVGNHEFDHGWRELLRLQKGGCHPTDGCQGGAGFPGAKFQYLAANVLNNAAPKRPTVLPAVAIRSFAGVKVGFIGETLMNTREIVVPTGVQGIAFQDEAATANDYAVRLKRQGVNAIVLLIHEGGQQNPGDQRPDPNGCVNFRGAIVPIVNKLVPEIRVVVSGHTHEFYNCTINGRAVTSAGSFGRLITRIRLNIDRKSGSIVGVAATNQIVTHDVPKDLVQSQIIAKYGTLSKPLGDRVIGSITSTLTKQPNAAGESALGGVIADAQLAATSASANGSARIAFMNLGGIRADLVGHRDPTTGNQMVSYSELFTVQPFGNTVTVLTMTGDMIRRVLEQQFDNPEIGERKMLQVSRGFSYRYTMGERRGRRVDPSSIKLDGRLIKETDQVRVVANSFLAAGGDGFTAFLEARNRVGGVLDVEAMEAYLKMHSPVRPAPQDRIVRTD